MSQSLHVNYVHIVFSTKHRERVLDAEVRPNLFAYMSGILRNLECYNVTVGGVDDHVHILCNLTKKHASMDVLEDLKKDSSKWIKTRGAQFAGFHWQDGYGLFSISPSHVKATRAYVMNQEEHHETETFQEEFLRILKKYDAKFDERYLWD